MNIGDLLAQWFHNISVKENLTTIVLLENARVFQSYF
jgi:hypothetical protein